jgi:hypothetical protein
MLVTIFAVGFLGGGDSQTESYIALAVAAIWAVASVAYIAINSRRTGRALMAPPAGLAQPSPGA